MNSSCERTEVFIPDDNLVWVTGCILNELADNTFEVEITDPEYVLNGKSAKRKTVSLKANKQTLDAFPLQNEVVEQGVDDMTNLNYLHEASILDNLRRRFLHKKPYTYTGDICIAVCFTQVRDKFSLFKGLFIFLGQSVSMAGSLLSSVTVKLTID